MCLQAQKRSLCFQTCRQITCIQSSLYHTGQLPVYKKSQLLRGGRPWRRREGNQPCMSRVPVCREPGGTGCIPQGTNASKTSLAARCGHNHAFVCCGGKEGSLVRRIPWGGLPGGRQGCCDALPGAELLPSLSVGMREKNQNWKALPKEILQENVQKQALARFWNPGQCFTWSR